MSIAVQELTKRYGAHWAAKRVSFEVTPGESFVLLGPSGSGKSTVLRLIAGLIRVDGGHVFLHGRDVTSLPPQARGVGLVFQHYALFRHMSVAQNIEFALRVRRVAAAERRRRRDELLEMVGLAGFAGRMPWQLSGGQEQRVALARALAHKPEVLLLDEPFGALDAKIRVDLRRAIRAIQRELGVTTLFVTHDQEEAFELADRIGVMESGRLVEVGPPRELYSRPETEFVATFLGTANLMVGECDPGGVRLGPVRLPVGAQLAQSSSNRRVQVLFRPEDVAVKDSPDALGWPLLGKAVVEESSFSGSFEKLRLRLPPLDGVRAISPPVPFGEDFLLIEASRSQHQAWRFPLHPGDAAWVGIRRIHALAHPGLNLLVVADGSSESRIALELCGQFARLARARVTILSYAPNGEDGLARLEAARKSIGPGAASLDMRSSPLEEEEAVAAESSRQHVDLLFRGLPERGRVELTARLLQAGEHNVLVVPAGAAPQVPSKVLVCVAIGEPGKEDVLFTGRLVRHLGAEATVVTVLPIDADNQDLQHAQRFLSASARSLALAGVKAKTEILRGQAVEQIQGEAERGGHGMIVVGTPLGGHWGRVDLGGVVGQIISRNATVPVLIIRTRHPAGNN